MQTTSKVLLALSLTASPMPAQSGVGGQVELGTYGLFTQFDATSVGLENQFGAGARLGFHLSRLFAFEASGDYTLANVGTGGAEVEVTRFGGTLLTHLRFGGSAIYFGGGAERLFYRKGIESDENGVHAVVGTSLSLGGRAALRVEGRGDYFPNSSILPAQSTALNLSATAGFSIYAFGGPKRDSDIDGIADRGDTCPGTPTGALVDRSGCPLDTDSDGAFDGLDSCPGTPAGAVTDVVGCPSDPDRDGVFLGIDACPDTPLGATVGPVGCPQDSDGDAVLDGLDQCPATVPGSRVDEFGCASDEDFDGVADGLDQCEGTPAGVPVDVTGCPADTDSDGVTDDIDACPTTPPGTRVDSTGCEIQLDSDGDGVSDNDDRCPNTPRGRDVDVRGCPVLFQIQQGQPTQPLVLRGVTFRSGSSRLTTSSFENLDLVGQSLIANPTVRIEIVGHTDNTGSRSGNLRLSLRRAESVRQYLIARGVAGERLVAHGAGPDEPIASNRTSDGRSRNRRVELRLIQN